MINVQISSYRLIARLGIAVVLCGAFLFSPQLSHAQAPTEEVNHTVLSQLFTVLQSLQQQVAAIAASQQPGGSTVTSPDCIDNKLSYKHDQTIPALTLSNGLKSSSKGNEYRCDKGRWIFQGIPKNPPIKTSTTTTFVNPAQCVARSKSYNAGVEIRGWSLIGEKVGVSRGSNGTLAASYICRNGTWIPVPPNQESCKLPTGASVAHGTVSTSSRLMIENRLGTTKTNGFTSWADSFYAKNPVTCMNGVWQTNMVPCKVGSEMVFHGDITTSLAAYNQYVANLPSKLQNSPLIDKLRTLKPSLICQNGTFTFPKQESAADRGTSATGVRSTPSNTTQTPVSNNSTRGTAGAAEPGKYGPQ